MNTSDRSMRVYDLPTRLFHWLFAGLFITAFSVAKLVDSESATFSYHMLAGIMLGFIVILRIIWGIFGGPYAKFSSFSLHPTKLVEYFSYLVKGNKARWVGHNPASSWATIIMLMLAMGLAISGYLMTTGAKETFEDLHELLANAFLLTTLAHIAGVFLHTLRHKDSIALSMLDGKKQAVGVSSITASNYGGVAFVFATLVALFSTYLLKNYNTQQQTLSIFGTLLQLGEEDTETSESKESGMKNQESEENESDD